ncbi:MAG TPA: DUF58 domain-containing protein [Ktedonobacterales bacterium]
MAYDTDLPVPPDENILSRRPWYLIGVVLIGLSLLFRQPLLIVAGLLVIALGGVPELWYRFCLTGVTVHRGFSTRRAEIGDEVLLTLAVENGKVLPLPRLDIEDEVPEEGLAIRGATLETSVKPLRMILIHTLSLWLFQRVTRRYHMRCLARGVYAFGPLRLKSGDPFGLLSRERQDESLERLIVYPLVVPVERLGLSARAPLGERPSPRRLLEDPLRTAGVRGYVPGDEPRRIHWKATARVGSLQSKIFEPTTHHTLVLFVDVRTYENPVLGYDPELMELTICAAASVACWALEQGYAVGIYANGILAEGDEASSVERPSERREGGVEDANVALQRAIRQAQLHLRLAPGTDPQQLVRIQEGLARLIPYYASPMTEIVTAEETHLPFGSTVAYIGAATALGPEGIEHLQRLRSRSHAVMLLITGNTQLDDCRLPMQRLGDADTWRSLLDESLGQKGIDRRGRPRAERTATRAPTEHAASGEQPGPDPQQPVGRGPVLEVRP